MEFAQALGPLPHWLELGPLTKVEGMNVHAVLGDWSKRHECDQLPEYFVDGVLPARLCASHDRGEDRAPIVCYLPGKDIRELRGTRSGPVAILFNGPSLNHHGLHHIAMPIIGMNRTHRGYAGYVGPQPDYLCVADDYWMQFESVRGHPALINGTLDKRDCGYRVARSFRMKPFSFDLWRDGYVHAVPCTTGHLALQFAVYAGFTELYCLGFDLRGGHFDGTAGSLHYILADMFHRAQEKLLTERGVKVYVCGSPDSAVHAFDRAPFEAVC